MYPYEDEVVVELMVRVVNKQCDALKHRLAALHGRFDKLQKRNDLLECRERAEDEWVSELVQGIGDSPGNANSNLRYDAYGYKRTTATGSAQRADIQYHGLRGFSGET